jgi:hypothetical protein
MVEDEDHKVDVTGASYGAATATTWRIEFRGVSKLVRWVSSKRNSTRNSNKLPLGGTEAGHTVDEEKSAQKAEWTPSTSTSPGASAAPRKLRRTRGRLRSEAGADASLDNHDDPLGDLAPTRQWAKPTSFFALGW